MINDALTTSNQIGNAEHDDNDHWAILVRRPLSIEETFRRVWNVVKARWGTCPPWPR